MAAASHERLERFVVAGRVKVGVAGLSASESPVGALPELNQPFHPGIRHRRPRASARAAATRPRDLLRGARYRRLGLQGIIPRLASTAMTTSEAKHGDSFVWGSNLPIRPDDSVPHQRSS
jgi:hypothetical protein